MARIETKPRSFTVRILALVLALLLPSLSILSARPALALQENIPLPLPWAADLPVYDHIVIIVEENKDYEQIIGNKNASYINDVLRKEGAILTKCYAEEHHSEGNYFWLFSGSNQRVGFIDSGPGRDFATSDVGGWFCSAPAVLLKDIPKVCRRSVRWSPSSVFMPANTLPGSASPMCRVARRWQIRHTCDSLKTFRPITICCLLFPL